MITFFLVALGILMGLVLLTAGYVAANTTWFLKEQYLNNRLRREVGIPTRAYRFRSIA